MSVCKICNFACDIANGEVGKCRVIQNMGGRFINLFHGQFSNIAVEAIEKKPFFHFQCGTKFLSCGNNGCNFACEFCMNSTVSQSLLAPTRHVSPQELIQMCKHRECSGIAFTYNEPTLYSDYIIMVSELARRDQLKIAVKTNGFATVDTIKRLQAHVDAFNVDIKGNDESYRRLCGGYLAPVMQNIELLSKSDSALEISYLVTPIIIDDSGFHTNMADSIAKLNPEIPVHILYYYPAYKAETSYALEKLLPIVDILKKSLNRVYVSNVYHNHFRQLRNTYCRKCGLMMVQRGKTIDVFQRECCGFVLE